MPPLTEISGYTLLRPLGQGGMAKVYLAVQQSLGREVAVKILSPTLAQDTNASERFLREARLAASLHHAHIVAIHDVGMHDGVPYIAMQFEPGGTVSPGELIRYLAKRLPHFMVPRYVRFMEALPRTPTGKPQKASLRSEGVTPTTWDRKAAGLSLRDIV